MPKKSLLNESQVRQFMKLASLTPLTPGFVTGLKESGMYRTDDEEVDESHGRGVGENPPHARGSLEEEAPPGEELEFAADDLEGGSPEEDAEADADIEMADDEMGLDAAGPEDAGRMISVEDFLSALETALEGVMGDEVEIDSDEMSDEEDAVEDEEAADMDMGAADMDMDMAADDEEMLEEEAPYGGNKDEIPDADRKKETKSGKPGQASKEDVEERGEKLNKESTEATDDLVEQVTKRVAARILKAALTKK